MSLFTRQLVVRRGGKALLLGVDLDVSSGERVALVGPNGAGKSTLIRCLAGSWKPDEGEVVLDGRPLAQWTPRALARRRAVLSQTGRLEFGFSVAEVVAMGRAPHGGADPHHPAVQAALETVGVWHLAQRSWGTLSGGERQRGRLARVLAQLDERSEGTRVLLLDEPTNHLDMVWQQTVLSVSARLAERGFAVVAALHDLSHAAAWADRVVVLHDGRIRADAPPADALNPHVIKDVYDLEVHVLTHPDSGRPLVVPTVP